jgi:hypothetical protein
VSTPAAKGGAAPPPPEKAPETPPDASPPSEADTTAATPEAPQVPAQAPQGGRAVTTAVVRARELVAPSMGMRELPLDDLRTLGWWLALSESGAQDEKARGGAAALRLYYVQQLGLPLWSVRELSLISGKLVVSSRLLRHLAQRAGLRIERADSSDDACTAVLIRASTGEEIGRATFTIEEAKRAGLIRPGSAWTTYPARMLWARASSHVLSDYAPGVVLGMQTEEEAREIYALQPEEIGVDRHYSYGDPDDLANPDQDIPF